MKRSFANVSVLEAIKQHHTREGEAPAEPSCGAVRLGRSFALPGLSWWLPFLLSLCLSGITVAQDTAEPPNAKKEVDWKQALVKVEVSVDGRSFPRPLTGVIVKADGKTATILTAIDCPNGADPQALLLGAQAAVTITLADDQKQVPGNIRNWSALPSVMTSDARNVFLVAIEVQHNGISLCSVSITEVPPAGKTSVSVVYRYRGLGEDQPVIETATIPDPIDPATDPYLRGALELIGPRRSQDSLMTVHSNDGTLLGLASASESMYGGGFGGGGFGGFADGSETQQPLTFVAIVDCADELRRLGLPVSDATLKLQTQRQRQHRDSFGRPVQSGALQITWSGDHKELHGFSAVTGQWAKLPIAEHDLITPILNDTVAAVSLKDQIAAFSARKGLWDLLTLPRDSKAVPMVSEEVVSVRDGKHIYTFAASSGLWTSPTDVNYQQCEELVDFKGRWSDVDKLLRLSHNRAVIQSIGQSGKIQIAGMRHHVDAAVEIIRQMDPKDSPPTTQATPDPFPTRTVGAAVVTDQASLQLAARLRDQDSPAADDVRQLRKLVTASFDKRLHQQQTLADGLQKRLTDIQSAIKSRQDHRDRIIERRVEELLNPEIDWSTLNEDSQHD